MNLYILLINFNEICKICISTSDTYFCLYYGQQIGSFENFFDLYINILKIVTNMIQKKSWINSVKNFADYPNLRNNKRYINNFDLLAIL